VSPAVPWAVWSRRWSCFPRWSIRFLSIYGSRFRVSVRTFHFSQMYTYMYTYICKCEAATWLWMWCVCGMKWKWNEMNGSHLCWLPIKMQINYVHFFWCQTIHLYFACNLVICPLLPLFIFLAQYPKDTVLTVVTQHSSVRINTQRFFSRCWQYRLKFCHRILFFLNILSCHYIFALAKLKKI